MAQHYLLSTVARTLSLAKVARLSNEEAYEVFCNIRWASTEGKPVCPHCNCGAVYTFKSRQIFKCQSCEKQFSVTSSTIFANRKLSIRDYLLAIAIFVNGAKGYPALQLSRDLDISYKAAFVLSHKLREAIASEQETGEILDGEVAVDGAYFGGHIVPANYKKNRVDRRRAVNQTGKRRVVVVLRQRNGRTLPFVFKSEAQSIETIMNRVDQSATIHADEATHWDALHSKFLTKRINHQYAYSHDGACTNMAESFFSRLRRAEIGTHHHISGEYLNAYAIEMAWREDQRRSSNGEQFLSLVGSSLSQPVSKAWKGYWRKSV
jgi:transposase-like protein